MTRLLIDLWIFGLDNQQIYGFLDLIINGFMDLWTKNQQICGFMDQNINRFMDLGTRLSIDLWIQGLDY